MAECPICGNDIPFEEGTVKGELIECSDCGSELEVISVKPFRVDEAPMEEEDWGQ
ncbi:MAG: lysine biosynthesis protein LysW [Ignavibacteriae bacterium]|nr:lysine biosynthesis protein LysW [Ignavibacteriota bacterium]MCB9219290.1 lysine biosynthesis protein LysW [Ignavibacteriales bacterium]MCB9260176.1 lysine biosynthesis protein LysW [Ignavibacteriales bacterium]